MHTADTLPKLWLPRHVYLGVTPEGAILLDLKRDKYFGLGGTHVPALAHVVHGWPLAEAARDVAPEQGIAIADQLERQGLLTRDATVGKPATPVDLGNIAMVRVGPEPDSRHPISLNHVVAFVAACASAAWALWRGPLEQVIERAWRRKQHGDRAAQGCDLQQLRELTMIFGHLRTFAYARKDRCLFNALALINFLAWYGLFPTWVIGVRARPFAAHSWVQHGELVLDASPDYIFEYTPLLAV